ncbi:hypothetical protein E1B28_004877 [Marasmius oreades]|uniref:NADAR domain-containing protein n=1 Tax=Marasmius oreades TaxID=181124 RepID=A0A9P7UZJ4_9AGAR|nr:uncharacterized protein E1B28_004877 [Marasmius oreades]KAG7097538.1 hypothetical protein E1B28_004877 [Marasmius oreades]
MGQNPSKGSKNQAYPLPNPAFYPPPPVYPYQPQHYGFPQSGGHVITPYPMMMYEPPHKRRKTRRRSGGTRRRAGQSAGPRRIPGTPGPAPRPTSRAGGTTRLRVTNSTAGDELDDDAPGPSSQSFSQPHPQRTPGPGPSGYVPPHASQHLDDDDDEPVVPMNASFVPFDENPQPVEQRAQTPHPGPVYTAPSSMQFTPHTRGLANFPVTDSEDEDEGEPVIPTQMGARSQSRSRAGSVSGHGENPRRAATPGLGLARSVTTGATLPTRTNPLPRPPQDLSRSTPWRRLRELDFSTTGHGTSSHGHGSVGHSTSTSHVPNTIIGHANGGTSSHGHDRTRSLGANPSRIIVQPPVQPPHTSQHHRAKTVGSFFRRGGIGAGVSHVSNVGGGIWRRVSQRRRPLNRPQSEEEFVEVQPPTPAAPHPGTITPYTITADQTRTPAASRPVTPAPPPMSELGGEESSTPFIPAGGRAMTPRIVAGRPPGMPGTTTQPTQPGRPVTPLGVSFTGTATPGIATPALGLVNPPFDQPAPPAQPRPMTQTSATSSTYRGPIHSTYDQPRAPSYDTRAPAPSQSQPPIQPQYSSTAPPITFSQLSSHPESGLLNHSSHRIVYTNPLARNQPASHQTYPTAAHLFEALKYLPHHPEHAAAIREAPTVADVYRLSSQWDADVRPDWGNTFLGIMEEVLMYKFRQHPSLRGVLLGTGVGGEGEQRGRELVYMDERDKFWGRAQDGVGRNELGKALMRVRERLKAEGYGS